jgi:hypothetical protein
MAQSGFASRFNFRKTMSNRSKGPRYETIVTTREELDEEEAMQNEINMKEESDEIDITKVKKASTVEDITQSF